MIDNETKPARPGLTDDDYSEEKTNHQPTYYSQAKASYCSSLVSNSEFYCASNGIEKCFECRINRSDRNMSFGDPWFFREELEEFDSPIVFKNKEHLFKNCSELALDQELDAVSKTSEWHLCKVQLQAETAVCERIYDENQEYCSKHNKECLRCGTREGVNSEFYCFAHKNECGTCRVRTSWEYCYEHSNQCKCLTCETRTNKEYCSQHTYKCYVNDGYPFKLYSFSCSERVAESHRYCSNHYQVCENFRCPNRISCSKSRCDACVNTDLCLNKDCGTRITKYTTYCSSCKEKDQLKDLVKQRTNLPGLIHEVARFKTWWSNENVATIITINGDSYWVFLGVIDRKPNSTGKVQNNEIFVFPTTTADENKWGIYPRKKHDSLYSVQSEASWLRTKLNGDNPILCIHPYSSYSQFYFDAFVREPYVIKEQIGTSTNVLNEAIGPVSYLSPVQVYSGTTPRDLDNYFKPLDIVWVKCFESWSGARFYHVGIVLGKNRIVHFSRESKGVRETDWEGFLKDTTKKIIRYHPIIPFKHYQDVIRHLRWALERNFREDNYDLFNRNCEHFGNMIVLGINFSKQIYDRPFGAGLGNNNKGAICLSNEIRESNHLLGKSYSDKTENLIAQIEIPTSIPIDRCNIM